MNKKVIITGCAGQDGSYMSELLLNLSDLEVIGTIRNPSHYSARSLDKCLQSPKFRLSFLDLKDRNSIEALIRIEKPDYFINLGASSFVPNSFLYPSETIRTNLESLATILESIRKHSSHCRIFSAGSADQFEPSSVYGVTKAASGQLCKVYRENYGIHAVHGILLNHESERRPESFVTRKISKGVARIRHSLQNYGTFEPIVLGNLDAKRDWSHAEDIVKGIWMMLNQPENSVKEYVLSSEKVHSVRDFVEEAFSVALIPISNINPWRRVPITGCTLGHQINYVLHGDITKPVVVVSREFFRNADVDSLYRDSTAARAELGWHPEISFKQLVRRMVENDIKLLTEQR